MREKKQNVLDSGSYKYKVDGESENNLLVREDVSHFIAQLDACS